MEGEEEAWIAIDEEIGRLEALLQDGNLYKAVQAKYHKPSDLEAVRQQQHYHEHAFGPRLKAALQARRRRAWEVTDALRDKYRRSWEAWWRQVRREEIQHGETYHEQPAPQKPTQPALAQNFGSRTLFGGSRSRSRSSLAGDVVRSEAELNQVLLSLLEQDREDPTMRWMSTLAVVPPMAPEPRPYFIDENGRIPALLDPTNPAECLALPTTAFMSPQGYADAAVWSPEEERVFIERYLHHPKDFAKIATGFLAARGKSTKDCVYFYYRQKKRLGLKQRLALFKKNPALLHTPLQQQAKKKVGRPPRNPQPAAAVAVPTSIVEAAEDDDGSGPAVADADEEGSSAAVLQVEDDDDLDAE